jgi:hypothetical protein
MGISPVLPAAPRSVEGSAVAGEDFAGLVPAANAGVAAGRGLVGAVDGEAGGADFGVQGDGLRGEVDGVDEVQLAGLAG